MTDYPHNGLRGAEKAPRNELLICWKCGQACGISVRPVMEWRRKRLKATKTKPARLGPYYLAAICPSCGKFMRIMHSGHRMAKHAPEKPKKEAPIEGRRPEDGQGEGPGREDGGGVAAF